MKNIQLTHSVKEVTMRPESQQPASHWTILSDAIGLASICLMVVLALSLTGLS